jgi:hypothetical protein
MIQTMNKTEISNNKEMVSLRALSKTNTKKTKEKNTEPEIGQKIKY